MPTILGANQLDTSYEVTNSARFDNTGGDALGGTFGTPTNAKKFTLAFWYKLCSGTTSGGQVLFGARSGNENIFLHESTMRMDWNNASGGTINWAPFIRDHSAWYHFVLAQDTSQSTNSNRIKFYINGVQITTLRSGVTATYPSQNLETGYNVDGEPFFVSSYNGSAAEINGYLAEVYFVDGQQYDPTYFGKFDDNGVWVPVEPGTGDGGTISYGNNGFLLEFKQTGTSTNSSGIGADTSGNDRHFSVSNLAAIDVTTDTPTNNFCTWNPLYKNSGNTAYTPSLISEGNLKLTLQNDSSIIGTMGVSSGKWYWEYKLAENTADNQDYPIFGFATNSHTSSASNMVGRGTSSGSTSRGNVGSGRVSNAFDDASLSANDIIGFYLDLDNETLILYKNGADWMGSGATNGLDISGASYANDADGFFYPFTQNNGLSITGDQANFGNPPFSISSGNADANGHGNFEYSPTIGGVDYFALCSKNLAEHG